MGKTEKEIGFLLTQIDLDKFHYSRSVSNFVTKTTILFTFFIGLTSIILSFDELSLTSLIKSILVAILIGVVIIKVLGIREDYAGQIGGYKEKLTIREEMMENAYKKLGVDTDKLKKEFEIIKETKK